jgi:hypothetical protein
MGVIKYNEKRNKVNHFNGQTYSRCIVLSVFLIQLDGADQGTEDTRHLYVRGRPVEESKRTAVERTSQLASQVSVCKINKLFILSTLHEGQRIWGAQ